MKYQHRKLPSQQDFRQINGLVRGNLHQIPLNNRASVDVFCSQGYQVNSFHHFNTFQKNSKDRVHSREI